MERTGVIALIDRDDGPHFPLYPISVFCNVFFLLLSNITHDKLVSEDPLWIGQLIGTPL